MRDTWRAGEQRGHSDHSQFEQRGRHGAADPYEWDRHERNSHDRDSHERNSHARDPYATNGHHEPRPFPDPRGPRAQPEPGAAPSSRRGRHAQDEPGPTGSQSVRMRGAHRDPAEAGPYRPHDSQPVRPTDSQTFRRHDPQPRPHDTQSSRPHDGHSSRPRDPLPPHSAYESRSARPAPAYEGQPFAAPADPTGRRALHDSQSFRRVHDSQGLPVVQDPRSARGAERRPDPASYRGGRRADNGETPGYRGASTGRHPGAGDSGEFRVPHRPSTRPDPHEARRRFPDEPEGHDFRGQPAAHQTGGLRAPTGAERYPSGEQRAYPQPRDVNGFGGPRAAHDDDYGAGYGDGDPYESEGWRDHDDLPLLDDRRGRRGSRGRVRRRRGKRVLGVFIVLALLAGLGAGAWVGWQQLRGFGDVPDYAGTGEAEIIAQVTDGASTADIGAELARLDVVASSKAFVAAAQNNSQIRSVQPGFYRMRTRMSGASAVTLLLEPASRVGRLEIRGGMQLDDVKLPDGKIVPGILSLISTASTAQLNGASTQVPVDQLLQAMQTTDPAALGVPDWAVPGVQAAEPRRRLEGLVVPGAYDVKPGASAAEILKSLVSASALKLQATALTDQSKSTGFSPYELLIISSLVEKEGITADFGKVSRVIYNRMADGQRLQLDSTINYPLDRQAVRTSGGDRQQPGPYNTYLNAGLPPTPIGSPSEKAIAAAVEPEPGAWRFFVKCQTDGTSCFAETSAEHLANVDDAIARGIF